MKERRRLRKPIFENRQMPKIALPIVAFIAIWLLAVFCGFWVETNDDIGLNITLQLSGSEGSIFIGPPLSRMIHGLYTLFPGINCLLITELLFVSLGAAMLVHVITQTSDNRKYLIVSTILVIMAMYFSVVRSMNFTKAGTVMATGGISWLLLYTAKPEKNKWYIPAAGLLAVSLGYFMRNFCGLAIIPIMGIAMLVRIFYTRESSLKQTLLKNKRVIAMTAAVVIVVGCSMGIGKIMQSDAEKTYEEYNNIRGQFTDYSFTIPEYEEAKEQYDKIGVNENDLNLYKRFMTGDIDFFNLERMQELIKLQKTPTFRERIQQAVKVTKQCNFWTAVALLIPFICTLPMVFFQKKGMLPGIVIVWGGYVLLIIFLLLVQMRINERAIFAVSWGAGMLALLLPLISGKEAAEEKYVYRSTKLIILFPVFLLMVGMFSAPTLMKETPWREIPGEEREAIREMQQNAEDTGCIYISSPNAESLGHLTHNMWQSDQEGTGLFVCSGGWFYPAKCIMDKYAEEGITNPMKDLLKKNVYYVRTDREKVNTPEEIAQYLEDHYSVGTVEYTMVDKKTELEIWKFTDSGLIWNGEIETGITKG